MVRLKKREEFCASQSSARSRRKAMNCPQCGLINPETALRCDCGHSFETKPATKPLSPAVPAPSYSLFDYQGVGLATFFGTPLAGSILMALNYRRLGNARAAAKMIGGGIVITALSMILGHAVPSSMAMPLAVGVMLAMVNGAKALQGPLVEEHARLGGKLVSRWAAFGIGVAVLVPFLLAAVAYVRAGIPSNKIVIGTKDLVYYSGAARGQDAKALGDALKAHRYFQDKGVSALLSKEKDVFTVSFVVKDGY